MWILGYNTDSQLLIPEVTKIKLTGLLLPIMGRTWSEVLGSLAVVDPNSSPYLTVFELPTIEF